MGATDSAGRVLASIGGAKEIEPCFQSNIDIVHGGMLLAIPALMVNGLLKNTKEHFVLPNGFYGVCSYFILLAFMALARVRSIENLRHIPPGEWGKLIGYDRIPEVRTLREKITLLTQNNQVKEWSSKISEQWLSDYQQNEEIAPIYVDGHMRVYHGEQTKLPRHYISRQKLCARGMCDYWVNAKDGQPFCYVSKTVNPGMINVLENDIIPMLEKLFPIKSTEIGNNSPADRTIEIHAEHVKDKSNQKLKPFTPNDFKVKPRFAMVCDRESFSPEYMLNQAKKGIVCMTYTKMLGEDWDHCEFNSYAKQLQSGEKIEYKLAERYVLKKIDKKPAIWVREIRKLKNDNTQGSITITDYSSDLISCYYTVVSRWSQENFFSYMTEHFGINSLTDYKLADLDESTIVINPNWRKIDSEIRKEQSILNRKKAIFHSVSLNSDIGSKKFIEDQKLKSDLLDEIMQKEAIIDQKKRERKEISKKIKFSELPDEQKFKQLNPNSKFFMDTIKMIAYRAETAMVNTLMEKLKRWDIDSSKAVIRAIYKSSADFEVDLEEKTLTVKLHHQASDKFDEAIKHLCEELTLTEMTYPETDLRLIYKMVSG